MFTVEDAKRVQRDLKLGDRHVAYVSRSSGFVLAHTDAERANALALSLELCPVHAWLCEVGTWITRTGAVRGMRPEGFPADGWYEITPWGDYRYEAKGLAL
jgi:hypothetical protein